MMLYSVLHRTIFDYEQMVSVSHHVVHLTPRTHGGQDCLHSEIEVDPHPALNAPGEDYFGNPVLHLTINEPHDRLLVEAISLVEVFADEAPLDPSRSPPWEDVVHAMEAPTGDELEAYQFIFESPHVIGSEAVRDYAIQSFPRGRPLLEAAADLTARVYREFEYRGGVSDISTPVAEVLAMRQGVCQDFAHLQIACLRSLGLPARYVSGYLLTRPREGQKKLVGSDASHAWLAVWAGDAGWVDFDPTNNLIPGVEHITLGWGRDYGDVSPINGFILGGGAHTIAVAVDVDPVATSHSGTEVTPSTSR